MRLVVRDSRGRFARSAPVIPATRPGLDAREPRYRLRVFHRAWPWRASREEALDDAHDSGNARAGGLLVPAVIQRDPPHAADRWKLARIRAERGH